MKRKIFLVEDVNSYHDKAGKAVPFYTYNPNDYGGIILDKNAASANIEELVELCDHDAENKNRHVFCGVHEKLAFLLQKSVGFDSANNIMRDIAYQGGLHGMAMDE